jgi:hypothetical protein
LSRATAEEFTVTVGILAALGVTALGVIEGNDVLVELVVDFGESGAKLK